MKILKLLGKYKKELLIGFIFFFSTIGIGVYALGGYSLIYPNTKINLSAEKLEEKSKEIVKNCNTPEKQGRQSCYREEYENFATKYGVLTSEKMILKTQEYDPFLIGCHLLAHYAGYKSYDRSPHDFYAIMKLVDVKLCSSGIFHGMLETYLTDHPELELNGKFADSICLQLDSDFGQINCAHLIGHVALINAAGIKKDAFPICEGMGQQRFVLECYDGLFMEDHQKLSLVEHKLAEPVKNTEEYLKELEKDCATYEAVKKMICWKEMGEMYDHVYHYSPKKTAEGCLRAKNQMDSDECYIKGSVGMAVYPTFSKPESLLQICDTYGSDRASFYRRCVGTIVNSHLYTSPRTLDKMITYCGMVKKDFRDICFRLIVKTHVTIHQNNLRAHSEICKLLPNDYKKVCN